MGDLAAFILARIEEDEAVARAATPGPWNSGAQYADANVWAGDDHGEGVAHASWEFDESSEANFAHIARHDPARVLAQCAAYREILEIHATYHECADGRLHGPADDDEPSNQPCPTLRALASIWADHESFDPAWRLT